MAGMRLAIDPDDTRYPFVLCLAAVANRADLGRSAFRTGRGGDLGYAAGVVQGRRQRRDGRIERRLGPDEPGPRPLAGRLRRFAEAWSGMGWGSPSRGATTSSGSCSPTFGLDWSKPDDEIAVVLTPQGPLASFPLPEAGRWRLVDATGMVEADESEAIAARFRELVEPLCGPRRRPSISRRGRRRSAFAGEWSIGFRQGAMLRGGRRGPHPQSGGRAGDEHRRTGRLQSGLEARPGGSWRGERRAARLLRRRAPAGGAGGAARHRPDDPGRDLAQSAGPRSSKRPAFGCSLASASCVGRRRWSFPSWRSDIVDSPIVAKDGPGWFMALQLGGGTAFKAERAFRHGPRAGDRMPDPPIGTSDPSLDAEQERRLSDVIFDGGRGPRLARFSGDRARIWRFGGRVPLRGVRVDASDRLESGRFWSSRRFPVEPTPGLEGATAGRSDQRTPPTVWSGRGLPLFDPSRRLYRLSQSTARFVRLSRIPQANFPMKPWPSADASYNEDLVNRASSVTVSPVRRNSRRALLMNAVRGVGDWIGDRFEIFAVHEGGMSLVYVVNDHLGAASGRSSRSRRSRTSCSAIACDDRGSPPNAASGCSSVGTRTSSRRMRWRSSAPSPT